MAEGSFSIKELHTAFGNTKQYKLLANSLNSYYIHQLNNKQANIPVLGNVFQNNPEYEHAMVELYNSTFCMYEEVFKIPKEIRASQAAVLDSLCYFYDLNNDELKGICTLNMQLLGLDPVLDTKVLDKIYKTNMEGHIHSVRVDINFKSYSNEKFQFKTVAHRTIIDEENVLLIPYMSGYSLFRLIQIVMSQNGILGIKQTMPDGATKIRCITTSAQHLNHYLDSPMYQDKDYFCSAEYYPTQGFFYAPVLGAPVTTLGKTKVNIFRIDNIIKITNYQACKDLGVQKSVTPIEDMLKENAIISALTKMQAADDDEYYRAIKKLPDVGVTTNVYGDNLNISTISNICHTASKGTVNKMLKLVKGAEDLYNRRLQVIPESSKLVPIDVKDFRDTVKTDLVKVVWKLANGMYSSDIVTNSQPILRTLYGKNYFTTYESIGIRVRCAAEDVMYSGMPVEEALSAYNLDESRVADIKSLIKEGKSIEDAFYTGLEIKRRASSYNQAIVTCRSISAYLSKDVSKGSSIPRAENYYVSVDTEHIVKLYKLTKGSEI